jgi:hypothetical protein
MNPVLHQRCWNHEAREAVCLCPACGRSFCRECVTEHEARLTCAACLREIARSRPARARSAGWLGPLGLMLGGILLSWIILFGAGEALMTFSARMEQTAWPNR